MSKTASEKGDQKKKKEEVVSKQKKNKHASGTNGKEAKSLSTKKPKLKSSGKGKSRKSRKPKQPSKSKNASRPKSKSDKILHHLKPQTKSGDDHVNSASIKGRIIEVNVDITVLLMVTELLFSILWLLVSFVLMIFGFSALPYFFISLAAGLSTSLGVWVLMRKTPEQAISAFAIGQLVFGFIELFWIAVIWYDSATYSDETVKATCLLEGLVIYQFVATILASWQPYRELNPQKIAKKCKDSVKPKLNGDKKQSKVTKNKKNVDSESSILSIKAGNLPKSEQSKQEATPNVRPPSSTDMSSTDVNTTSGKTTTTNGSRVFVNQQKSQKSVSNELRGIKEMNKGSFGNKNKEYTVSMMSTPTKKPEMTPQNRDNHVAFHLPKPSNPSSGTSLDNILRHTPSDAGSINANFAGVTPIQELPPPEPKQTTSNSASGSVYASPTLR